LSKFSAILPNIWDKSNKNTRLLLENRKKYRHWDDSYFYKKKYFFVFERQFKTGLPPGNVGDRIARHHALEK
jgi:hypothetical protein